MVVEDDLLDLRIERDRLELAEPGRVSRLDDDQAADRAEVEPGRLYEAELVRVQAVELAHVPVERTGQAADRLGIQATRGEHRREGVEVGVPVGRDDGVGLHAFHSASAPREKRPIPAHSRV